MRVSNIIKHFKTICKHKYYVGKYCFMAGIPLRGIKHDLSKFSPIEFFESAKHYQGNRSPVDACKEINGYSKAWLHHKGRNSHHYEYYVDNLDHGGQGIQMPFKDACELICDYLGAGRAYMGKDFSFTAEYNWWLKKQKSSLVIHPQTKAFIEKVLFYLRVYNNPRETLNKNNLKKVYKEVKNAIRLY